MCALLLAGAHTQLIDKEGRPTQQQGEAGPTDQVKGQPTTTEPSKQHAAPPQPQSAFAAPAPPDAGDPAMDSSVPLSWDILRAAKDGKVTQVVSWLNKGGLVNAIEKRSDDGTGRANDPTVGTVEVATLLHVATEGMQPKMVRELLKRGANVNWQNSEGVTALMIAVDKGHLPTTNVLVKQPGINLDLININANAFMVALPL